MRLSTNEVCPIHRSRYCCGRAPRPKEAPDSHKWQKVGSGVYRISDPHAPNGYRERRSKAAMRRLVIQKVREQNVTCSICGKHLLDMSDVVPDHIDPRGMGGAFKDDSPSNIAAAHSWCNLKKGSKRVATA